MSDIAEAPELQWIGLADASDAVPPPPQRDDRLVVGLVTLAFVVALLVAAALGRPERAEADDAAVVAPALPVPTTVQIDGEVNPISGAAATTGIRFAGVAHLGSSRVAPQLITVDRQGTVGRTELPMLSMFAIDASGRWIAGTADNRSDESRELWVGPVTGVMEPFAADVTSFAWHGTRPGELAWLESEPLRLRTVSVNGADEPTATALTLDDTWPRLRGWGEWGFAIDDAARGASGTILDSDGLVLAANVPGRFSGFVPDHGVLMTGQSPAVYVELEDGAHRHVDWIEGNARVSSLEVSELTGTIAAVVRYQRNTFDAANGEVVVVNGGEFESVGTTTVTSLAWSPGGRELVFLGPWPTDPTRSQLVIRSADGTQERYVLPRALERATWTTTFLDAPR